MKNEKQHSRILGALYGVAIGDAMGMPSEFWTRKKIKNKFGKIETFLPAPKNHAITAGLNAGEVTDDTWMTIIVSQCLIENHGVVIPEKIVTAIKEWIEKDIAKITNIIGPSTKRAFDMIDQGESIEEAGKFGVTNGGAMRIIPIGIISNYQHRDELINNVELSCRATHNTNIAISGACAIAAAVSYCIEGGRNLDEMIEIAKLASEKGQNRGFEIAGASGAKRIDLAISIVKSGNTQEDILQDLYDIVGTGLATNESIPVALALVYYSKGNLVECVKYTANIGGDTDTIGAMACGICGAFSGIDAIPNEYIHKIIKANNMDFIEIAIKLGMYRD